MNSYRLLPPYSIKKKGTLISEIPLPPVFLTVQKGMPVLYSDDTIPTCGVRVVHPSNSLTSETGVGVSVLYVPPMASMALHDHEAEEVYIIDSGTGEMLYRGGSRAVAKGDFIYLPPWCEHGIANTGTQMLTVILALSPPNP
jgi:mannose-6-phosphate isomerase-like protein (cupin superfamily)